MIIRKKTMAWGHEHYRVTESETKGEDVDFEAENQAMSDWRVSSDSISLE